MEILAIDGLLLLGVIALCMLAKFISRRVLLRLLSKLIATSRIQWDDLLMKHGFFRRLSHFIPALLFYLSADLYRTAVIAEWVQRLSLVYFTCVGMAVIDALLNALVDFYHLLKDTRGRPIKGYVQTVKIFVYLICGILIIAAVMNRSPWKLLSGVGAVSAILLLVFKDSILGLVASVQITAYEMVRSGDWIEMPNFGADGSVIDVSLHTVKIQNWDNTITTIPTQALISDSFKNWRGMSESGGRRIKRCLLIDMNSIRFCDERLLDRFESFQLISEYIRGKREEVEMSNQENRVTDLTTPNARRLTNIGCFRAYVLAYVRNHPKIRKDLTLLVRQLPPGAEGLPLEIYVFTNDTVWVHYEDIQSDIFDHLLAAIPEFELRLFQNPSGLDVQSLHAPA